MTPTPADEQAQLLGQYRRFWSGLTAVQRLPVAERRAALAAVAVDPALQSLLQGMAATDAKGHIFYGANFPRATEGKITADGAKAVVDDCQDSSKAGVASKASGKPITVGVARSHVVVTMQRSGDVWKVSFVSHPKTPC